MAQSKSQSKLQPVPRPAGLAWRANMRAPLESHWSDVDANAIRGAIDAVTRQGGAVMFSTTSDGGAFSVCVLYQGEKSKEYPHGADETEQVLRDLVQYFTEVGL